MAATNATTFLVGFAMTGFFVAMPALVQSPSAGFGASPLEAGLLLLPFSVAMMIGGPAGGALLGRAGRLAVLRGGLATAALAVALMAVAHDDEALLCAWLADVGRRRRVRAGRDRRAGDRSLAPVGDRRGRRDELDHADGRRLRSAARSPPRC